MMNTIKIAITLILLLLSIVIKGQSFLVINGHMLKSGNNLLGSNLRQSQIIADHNAVIQFNNIPSNWIDSVKKMYVYFTGASHSDAYRTGLTELEDSNNVYQVNIASAQASTSSYLRSNQNPSGYTEENIWLSWWDYAEGSKPVFATWITDLLSSYNNAGYPLDVIGDGWCWQMGDNFASSGTDPITGNNWWGSSMDGIDGEKAWGLNDADYAATSNRVNLQDYFSIVEYINSYCIANGIKTRAVYTTGPVTTATLGDEPAYSVQLKHNAIRAWVAGSETRILFDYLDILSYDYNGIHSTNIWNGNTYEEITTTNLLPEAYGHISVTGAVRLAKAQWWMLARMAGWDGN